MERLTEVENGTAMVKGCGSNCKYGFEYCRKEDWENCKTIEDVIDKLAEYEGLEEQGRLVKLPCKVGDVVYYVCDNRVMSSEVLSVKYHAEAENHGVFIRERLAVDFEGIPAEIDFDTIGKTVFLTKSEAEAKLKELRGGENE